MREIPILKKMIRDESYIKGFSMVELLIVLIIISVLSFIAIPKFLSNKETLRIESSVLQLLSMLQLASNEALNNSKDMYVHYLTDNDDDGLVDGCIVINDSKTPLDPSYCSTKGELNQSKFFRFKRVGVYVRIALPPPTNPFSPMFNFSAATGLPSKYGGIYFYAYVSSESSGIDIRTHQGLQGCSDTTSMITGWPICGLD
ncbi:MAG: pilus assembly FimT family protein [Enterovibrio sp.]